MARTIDLEERKQFRVLLNPVRQDIIHLLRRAGRPMTANTVAEKMLLSPSAAQSHLNKLEELGVVELGVYTAPDGRQATYYRLADVEIRKIKANLVSVNVDRLVQEGYLERRAVAGDRRKTQLLCTEKAQPVIARGREVQERFFARLLDNTDAPTREAFFRTMEVIGKNLDEILKENG